MRIDFERIIKERNELKNFITERKPEMHRNRWVGPRISKSGYQDILLLDYDYYLGGLKEQELYRLRGLLEKNLLVSVDLNVKDRSWMEIEKDYEKIGEKDEKILMFSKRIPLYKEIPKVNVKGNVKGRALFEENVETGPIISLLDNLGYNVNVITTFEENKERRESEVKILVIKDNRSSLSALESYKEEMAGPFGIGIW